MAWGTAARAVAQPSMTGHEFRGPVRHAALLRTFATMEEKLAAQVEVRVKESVSAAMKPITELLRKGTLLADAAPGGYGREARVQSDAVGTVWMEKLAACETRVAGVEASIGPTLLSTLRATGLADVSGKLDAHMRSFMSIPDRLDHTIGILRHPTGVFQPAEYHEGAA